MASMPCTFHALPLVLLVLLSPLTSPTSSGGRAAAAPGGWSAGGRTYVENVEGDREVQELGLFCVVEHNRRGSHRLLFSRVVAAQTQMVSGIKYYLRIAARDDHGASEQVFDAIVVVKAWLPSRLLVSFVPAAEQPGYVYPQLAESASSPKNR